MRILLFLMFALAVQVSGALAQKPKPKTPAPAAKNSKSAAAPKKAAAETKKTAAAPKKAIADSKKPAVEAKNAAKTAAAAKISDTEWKTIVTAIETEDWNSGASLSATAMKKLKADNAQKQLSRLRYFYLFALAGQAADGKISYAELEKTAADFAGKEFLMPSRQTLGSCRGRLNYICPASDDGQIVRVTATNLRGSEIHSFEYVRLTEKASLADNQGRAAFLGGKLQTAEISEYKSGIKALRLVFDRGHLDFIKTP